MKSFSKTTILLGLATSCAVVAGGIYVFFFVSMKSKTDAVVDLSAQLGELSSEQSRYKSAASLLQAEGANIAKLSSYFIKESEIVSFTKKIETLGTQAGVVLSIESLDPGATTAIGPFLNFQIAAEGKFENVERLVVLLQNFPGKFEWKSVRLTRVESIAPADSKAPPVVATPRWKVNASLTALNFIKE